MIMLRLRNATDASLLTLNPFSRLQLSSDQTPDYQLEVVVHSSMHGVGSRFVAYDSLSVLKMHRVGLVIIISNPVMSSLQHYCTVLGVELKTN